MKKQQLVDITLHGVLGEHLKHTKWKFAAKTVGHCLNAIEILSHRRFYRFLLDNDKKGIKYRVLINGRDFVCVELPTIDKLETIYNSELCAKIGNLETIDIIPVLEGAGGNGASIGTIIAGVALIIGGIFVSLASFGGATPLGVAMIIAGVGLIAAGVLNLLMKGPELEGLKAQQKTSFLFGGPQNVAQEGVPVPVGYGRLMIGSSIISASYEIELFDTGDKSTGNVNA